MNDVDKSGRRSFLEQSIAMLVAAGVTAAPAFANVQQESPKEPSLKGSTLRFFPGFEAFRLDTGEAIINGVMGGSGPPLLLLQGYPQTHLEWHRLAPMLAQHFTVVATDLRGYGDSSKPADGENHEGYSKRSMAKDQVAVMQRLGFNRFLVVGHDHGGRVGHRMALDYPDQVTRLAVLDIVPTYRLYQLEHDKADLDRKVECPLLVLWGAHGAMERLYDVTATWRERATQVQGKSLPGGHWLPEQLPNEVYAELMPFLR